MRFLYFMQNFEVELKVLLGSQEYANELKKKLYEHDAKTLHKASSKQLNHYFIGKPVSEQLIQELSPYIPEERHANLFEILLKAKKCSIRTRLSDATLLFVVKASVDDTTSANGLARMEFEAEIKYLTLEELDTILLGCGLSYEAKWSREREEYSYKDMTVSIDKNAGYGYVAEFEKIEQNEERALAARDEIRKELAELNIEELSQERLERMFAYYNERWEEYYGTEKVFTIH